MIHDLSLEIIVVFDNMDDMIVVLERKEVVNNAYSSLTLILLDNADWE